MKTSGTSITSRITTSRRTFLKESFLGATFVFTARHTPGFLLPGPATGQVPRGLLFFSEMEYLTLRAVAERIIGPAPPGGQDIQTIDVAVRADRFLATADPEIQEQFHLLLTVFNAKLFTFLLDFRFSSFIDMKPEDQDSYLRDWMTSRLAFRRTGFQSLKRLCTSMFYTDTRTWDEIGYSTVLLPQGTR